MREESWKEGPGRRKEEGRKEVSWTNPLEGRHPGDKKS